MDSLGSHRARKRFGQNFLTDQNIIERIVRSINPQAGEQLVEIGPGRGALTRPLAEHCDNFTVIELDRDLVPWLRVMFEQHTNFRLRQADALSVDFAELADPGKKLRVVGNLPYNISTPLIFHLLRQLPAIADMHFMLQQEVVDRLAAGPGDKAYGRLGIMVQYHCEVQPLFGVPPGAFRPAPKVNSAVVRLAPHRQLPHPAEHPETLAKLVNVAFQQRRKTLRNSLKMLLPVAQVDQLPLDLGARPETLSLETFVQISNILHPLLERETTGDKAP